MRRLSFICGAIAVGVLVSPHCTQAQTQYSNPSCEYRVTFPQGQVDREDEFTARTPYEAIPYLSAKCFRCPQACRLRQKLEKELLSGLIAEFAIQDYVVTSESTPRPGFLVSGVTTKENSLTRIEARVLFGENSILVLATVRPEATDKLQAKAFLKSAEWRPNAP